MSSPATSAPAIPAPRVDATGCIDGLITIPTADGPELTACRGACCRQTREAARAERAARAAKSTAFDRLPVTDDEEW